MEGDGMQGKYIPQQIEKKWQQIWESADRACMTTSNAVIRFFRL